MTLRDWFAGMAMQGFIASWDKHGFEGFGDVAADAYAVADAMLNAREAS